MRKLSFLITGISAGLIACNSDLLVDNLNNPDVGRVLARPTDVESTIASSYGQMHQAAFGLNGSITPSLLTMSFENASSLANFQMGPRGGIPRIPITNTRGNAAEAENVTQFTRLARAARTAANGIVSLDKPNFTIGTDAANQRARAFASARITSSRIGDACMESADGLADARYANSGDHRAAVAAVIAHSRSRSSSNDTNSIKSSPDAAQSRRGGHLVERSASTCRDSRGSVTAASSTRPPSV